MPGRRSPARVTVSVIALVDYFERLNADRLTRYHAKRLAARGYAVSLTTSAA